MLRTTVNGVELAYKHQGHGTAMLLIHGHPLDHAIWDSVIPLMEDEFDLIVPDLRGFGQSETVQTPYSLTDMAADLAALLDFLGIRQVVLAGHSMGGYIALAFARAYPRRVLGLGLVASQVFADPAERKPGRYQTAAEIEKQGIALLADSFPEKLSTNPSLQILLREIILRQSVHGAAASLRAIAEREDASMFLAEAEFPVVIIHGSGDALIPLERARKAKALAGKAQMVEIEGSGHMPMLEYPEATVKALLKLVK
jgi:3-oxoadipate enol-lactonase